MPSMGGQVNRRRWQVPNTGRLVSNYVHAPYTCRDDAAVRAADALARRLARRHGGKGGKHLREGSPCA
eukprot:365193-Chlamydomonas_euryale.AAC.2